MEPDIANSDSTKTQEAQLPDTTEADPINPPKNGADFFVDSNIYVQKSITLLKPSDGYNKKLIFLPPANLSVGSSTRSLGNKNICSHVVSSDISNYSSSTTSIDSDFKNSILDPSTLTEITCKKSSGELKPGTKKIDIDVVCRHDISHSRETDKYGTSKLHNHDTKKRYNSIPRKNRFSETLNYISYKNTNSKLPSPTKKKSPRSLSSDSIPELNHRPQILPPENEISKSRDCFLQHNETEYFNSDLNTSYYFYKRAFQNSGKKSGKTENNLSSNILSKCHRTYPFYKCQKNLSKNCLSNGSKGSNSFCESNGLSSVNSSKFVTPLIPLYIETPCEFGSTYSRKLAASKCKHLSEGIASSFTDLVSLYENFAGGNYISEDDSDDYLGNSTDDEMLETYNQPNIIITDMANDSGYNSISRERSTSRGRPNLKASSKKAFFLLIKSFVGTGVLFLPKSFHNGGLLFSIFTMVILAYLALHCMLLLVECHSKLKMSYGDIGYHLMGEKVRTIVHASIVFSQIGFCCAYSIFVATNTKFLFNTFTDCKMDLPLSFWILIQFIIYIPMSMVRKIKKFSILALIANVFIVIGIGYLFYYDGHVLAKNGISDIVMFNPETFSMLVGTAAYSFEGIGLVIPVVESMETPSEFPKVLSLTVFVSAVIFISVASFSYMAFGENVETVILLNLTEGGNATTFIQFLYSIAIMFSVPLQLFPAIRILETKIFTRSGKRNCAIKWQKNTFRLGLCLFVAASSTFVSEKLDEFVSIIGSFACVPLAFIYPSIFHYYAIDTNSRATKIKDICLFIFGIFTMFYVTHLSITQWGKGPALTKQCPNSK
ncbi:Vacuolar amino acid transporter 3 [Smittium culicis]|uniref:Vacuolar amino acid transporter 3 n=1 Tax=Smittium culicis TaxID=133412 RepID=A0A1R1XGF2_9FUNG|nr:Vacuolar amino acid transporter 3 [Smittium culicis]